MNRKQGSSDSGGGKLSRRELCATTVLAAAAAPLAGSAGGTAEGETASVSILPVPIPLQVPAREGTAQLTDARLWYWDTGGEGPPVVLLHPASGSALIWLYQQPVFAKAGYRVIAYSRRGHYQSDPLQADSPGVASEDLHRFIELLGLRKFHLLGSAAGGSIAVDYALSHPDRPSSLTVACNSAGVREGAIFVAANAIRPKGWDEMPVEFRELGPSYRAVNPEGVKQWLELERKALVAGRARQRPANVITEARLGEIKAPTLLIAGAADLIAPPSILRMVAARIPGSETAVAAEAGHSVYWEQPEFFNRAVLGFLARHSN
jgi:pimeloyl-ACP methyl ester carboxylesterase